MMKFFLLDFPFEYLSLKQLTEQQQQQDDDMIVRSAKQIKVK
jgi:hypothetical protein